MHEIYICHNPNPCKILYAIYVVYNKPGEQIPPGLLEKHIDFLVHYYKQGYFLISGRSTSATGGFILSTGKNLSEIESILSLDPFIIEGWAFHEVMEFYPTRCVEQFASDIL